MTLENLDTVIAFVVVILLLSLIITSIVQMISWACRFREHTLLWGVTRILRQLVPAGASQDAISKLAEKVVSHESLKRRDGRNASVISFDELVNVLQVVADPSSKELDVDKLTEAMHAAPIREVTNLATAIVADLAVALPQQAVVVTETVERVKKKTLEAGTKLRFWFDTIMSRTTERFASKTRAATVVAAIVVAFGARVDSLDILRQLSQRPDIRAKLVQMSDPLMKQAAGILEPPATVAVASAADAHAKATGPERTQASVQAGAAKDAPLPGALKRVKLLHPEIPSDLTGPDSNDLDAWKSAIGAKVPAELEERILAEFTDEYGRLELDHLLGQFKELNGTLSQTSLEIVSFRWKDYPKHIPGIMLSVFFLSLGAPFWFNTLRYLSALRPLLARKVDEEESRSLPDERR